MSQSVHINSSFLQLTACYWRALETNDNRSEVIGLRRMQQQRVYNGQQGNNSPMPAWP